MDQWNPTNGAAFTAVTQLNSRAPKIPIEFFEFFEFFWAFVSAHFTTQSSFSSFSSFEIEFFEPQTRALECRKLNVNPPSCSLLEILEEMVLSSLI